MMVDLPKAWLKTLENIRKVRQKYPAPVDTMGCDQASQSKDVNEIDKRFHCLVSLMLSSQTKDPITWGAVKKLRDNGYGNVKALREADEKDIEDLIHPVGFYRRKAIYLKKVATILDEQYGGDIPNSIEQLCKLPGVGPKMAHLCMSSAWNEVTGIGVDTHVHRISARLGWVPRDSIKSPEDTRKALESWLPREYWHEINHLLVGFGQTICTPLRPKCDQCYNSDVCPRINVASKTETSLSAKRSQKSNPKSSTVLASSHSMKRESKQTECSSSSQDSGAATSGDIDTKVHIKKELSDDYWDGIDSKDKRSHLGEVPVTSVDIADSVSFCSDHIKLEPGLTETVVTSSAGKRNRKRRVLGTRASERVAKARRLESRTDG